MTKTLKFIDSMQHPNLTSLDAYYEETTGALTFSAITGPHDGLQAVRIDEVGGDGWFRKDMTKVQGFTAEAEFLMGAHVRFDAGSHTGDARIFSVWEGATHHMSLGYNNTPVDLKVFRATTQLDTTLDTNLTVGNWYHIQFAGKIDDSAGYYYVYVDGTQVGFGTSKDTRNAGTTGLLDKIAFGFVTTVSGNPLITIANAYYYSVTSGPEFLSTIPRASRKVVNAAGTYADFTPLSSTNVSNVDDTSADGDTTYNESSDVGDIDSFGYADIPTNATVLGLQTAVRHRKTDAGARTLGIFNRSGGNDYVGTDITMNETYNTSMVVRETDPATTLAWAASAINSNEIGYKVKA